MAPGEITKEGEVTAKAALSMGTEVTKSEHKFLACRGETGYGRVHG